MKVKLNDTKKELESKKEELGLSKESAGEENIYGIGLPIAICTPFNAREMGIVKSC